MKINQVLVVFKQISDTTSTLAEQNEGNHLHLKTLDKLYSLLRKLGISFDAISAKQLKTIKDTALVVSVGGDGTVLMASHFIEKAPIIGIKSFGQHSVGHFCAATTETMEKYLQKIFDGEIRPKKLTRLEAEINNHVVRELALNEFLFAHSSPAATSRYKLTIGNKNETQKSSGIWIGTPAGSTAVISSAGGKKLPLGSDKIEYLVREPYQMDKHYELTKGILQGDGSIKVVSLSQNGTIYIDGPHIQYPAPEGTKITIKNSKKPLNIFWK